MLEQHPLCCNAVNVWRVVDACAITTDGLGGMVVRKDEDNVRSLVHHGERIGLGEKKELEYRAGSTSMKLNVNRKEKEKEKEAANLLACPTTARLAIRPNTVESF